MWNNPQAAGTVAPAVGKGCLAGFGLAGLFLVIGGLMYLLLGVLDLGLRTRLLIAILSGPLVGTFGTLLVAYVRSSRAGASASVDDESTPRD